MLRTPLDRLRAVALVEGLSFLLLLGVAMPLKYAWGMPMAVRVVGMAHGVLFLAFVASLAETWAARRWPLRRAAFAFVASVVPFGTFVLDRSLRAEALAPEAAAAD